MRTHRAKTNLRSVVFFRVFCRNIQQERVDNWGNNETKKVLLGLVNKLVVKESRHVQIFTPGAFQRPSRSPKSQSAYRVSLRSPGPKCYVGRVPPFLVSRSPYTLDRDDHLSQMYRHWAQEFMVPFAQAAFPIEDVQWKLTSVLPPGDVRNTETLQLVKVI